MTEPAAMPPAVSTGRLTVQAVLRTDVGLVRSENQDFGIYTTPDEERDSHPGGRLLIVADGMGGHRGGATASRLAGETVKAQYLGSDTADIATALRDSLARANSRIFSEAQANPDLRGMGTTTSALAVRGNDAWFAHVGDSRIYLVRGDEIKQLTDDHSLVATMVREGLLTTKEAETHPRRNVLQRSMGVAEEVEIDVRGPYRVQDGDTFILCSDGLHGLVKEDEIRDIARRSVDEAADEYLRRALERGAPDNVTVIVARVHRSEGGESIGDETVIDRIRTRDEGLDETLPLGSLSDAELYENTFRDGPHAIPNAPAEAVVDPAADIANKKTEELPAPPLPRTEEVPMRDPSTVDTQPMAAIPASDSQAIAAVTVEDPATVDTEELAAVKSGRGSMMKWMLLVALALGAAGAWVYWNYQQGIGTTTRSSSPTSR